MVCFDETEYSWNDYDHISACLVMFGCGGFKALGILTFTPTLCAYCGCSNPGKGDEDCLIEATSYNIYFWKWKLNINYILLGAHQGSGTVLSTVCKITKLVFTIILWGTETDEETLKGKGFAQDRSACERKT